MAPDVDRPTFPDASVTSAEGNPVSIVAAHVDPDTELPAGVIGCVFCANTKFRRSRLRFYDVGELMMLRYPMRCMRCNQRQYGYLVTAAYALPPRSHNNRVDKGTDTWKAWTESERNAATLQRPMTTSIGTRATKLQRPSSRGPRRNRAKGDQDWRSGDDDRQIW